MIDHLTIVMPFYINPGMLGRHYDNWMQWPQVLRDRLGVIIVDDGSPSGQAIDVPRPEGLDISIYRVVEDMPWHQHGARNLGAHVAQEGWMLLTDMDHMLQPDAAKRLFAMSLNPDVIYTLDRVEADTGLPTTKNGNLKPHPNSFVVTRKTFWHIGGYDEEFCGTYGTDGFFRARAFSKAIRGHLHAHLTRYWHDIVSDSSTTTLPRKEGRDPTAKKRIQREKVERGDADVVRTLQFEWERVL